MVHCKVVIKDSKTQFKFLKGEGLCKTCSPGTSHVVLLMMLFLYSGGLAGLSILGIYSLQSSLA